MRFLQTPDRQVRTKMRIDGLLLAVLTTAAVVWAASKLEQNALRFVIDEGCSYCDGGSAGIEDDGRYYCTKCCALVPRSYIRQ